MPATPQHAKPTTEAARGPGRAGPATRRVLAGAALVGLILRPPCAPAKEFAPLTIAAGSAEEYSVCRWSMEDGLPENDLRELRFDQDGFLFCIGGGSITRFDGLRFTTRSRGLPIASTNQPWCWVSGSKTWAASSNALLKATDHGYQTFPLPSSPPGAALISTVAADEAGRIWIAAGRRILRFEREKFTEEKLPPDGSVAFRHFAFGPDGTVWAASATTLCRRRRGRWETVPVPEDIAGQPFHEIRSLFAAPDGALWVATQNTLYHVRYGLWPEVLQNEQTPLRGVNWIGLGPDGSLWLAGTDGLRQLRQRSIRIFRAAAPLRQTAVTALAVDAQGRLLAGVADLGLAQAGPVGELAPCVRPGLPERPHISALVADREGALWVGTSDSGLWRCHDNQADRIPEAGNSAAPTDVHALLVDRTGRLLAGTERGLLVFDGPHRELVSYTNATGRMGAQRVNALLEDHTGRIWVGTQFGGLLQLATNGALAGGATPETILALHEDSDGVVWAGTPSGLERWQDGRRARLLPGEYVAQILDDNLGHLWLGLRRGLARISQAELRAAAQDPAARVDLRFFGVSEGFPAAPCASGRGRLAAKTSDGKLWFATRDGLALVDPWRVTEPPAESLRVFVEELYAGGRAVWSRPPGPATPVTGHLPPGTQNVEFRFTAPCFTEPEAVRFTWRLEGFENGWTEPSAQRQALYPQLPPGHYQFRVRAGWYGRWSPATVAPIEIAPWFWQTGWWRALSYTAGALLAAGLALGVYRWRMRRQQQLDRLRLRIARDLHDEIGSNLGGIALLLGLTDQPQGAEALRRIRAITLESIEALKDLVWLIDPAHDSLADTIQRMRDVADRMLAGLTHEFRVQGAVADVRAPLEVRRNLLPIFKEALHNIIQHARARRVVIELTLAHDRLSLSVRDDGAGLAPAGAPGGHGLSYMRRRAEELHGSLRIASQAGQGTTLLVQVPL